MLGPSLPQGVRIAVDAQSLSGDWAQAAALGVIASEFAMNSAKHGFSDGRSGTIGIALRQRKDGGIDLRCHDDGVGHQPATQPGPGIGHGIGLRLIEASVEQLGGQFEIEKVDKGFALVVRMPPPA